MSDALRAMREAGPLVHCITNYVAMNISANVLLAAGASPAMIHTSEETPDFAKIVGSLTVNIGTLSPHWVEGMKGRLKLPLQPTCRGYLTRLHILQHPIEQVWRKRY